LLVYGRTAAFGYVDFDDPLYVTDNPHVREGLTLEGVRWALTSGVTGNWHPLTWISLMADESLGGGAATHHGVNVLLHLVNTLLVFGLLASSTGRLEPSGWVAALFAVHPLHVESVAWISERKDVLCALFGLIAIGAYGWAVLRGRTLPYLLSCLAFAASLAAKPMLVTLPILLLVVDRWPLARPRSLLDKGPYAVLALGASALALTSQRGGGAIASAEALAWSQRAANVPVACLAYLGDIVWPAGLSPLYGILPGGRPAWSVVVALVVLAALGGMVWALRRERPWIAAGGVWFVVSLIPVAGIVQIGVQSRADRYMYLAMLGPLVGVVFTLDPEREGGHRRMLARAAGAVAVGALAAVAWRQTGFWRDGVTLFARAVAVEPWNAYAQHGLGIALHTRGDTETALAPLARAVALSPGRADFRKDYGGTLLEAGRHADGVAELRAALELDPGDTRTRVDLARLRVPEGDLAGALAGFDEALRLAPSDPYALKWKGATLLLAGRLEEGRAALEAAARLDPDDVQTRGWLTRPTSGAAPDDPVRRAW
jgi:Flp pilus assembly protein TadD